MTKIDLNVDVHHLTRVEGHGNINVKVRGGALAEASWEVVETPRFFEVMFRGKHYSSAGILSARICGICSIAHCLTSLEAIEDAFEVEVPETARKLRLLAKHGETLQSHYLHLFFLAAPDYLRLPSVIPLVSQKPEIVAVARRLKGLANRLCDLVAGRTTHPVSLAPGGVTAVPARKDLLAMRDELARSVEDVAAAVELFRSIELPEFERQTEFVSIKSADGEYPYIGRQMVSTDGVVKPAHDYLAMTNEYVVPNNTTKWCKLSRDSLAVGSLARFNNNHDHLLPQVKELADSFGLSAVCHNPFMANIARLVECVQATYEAMELISELTAPGGIGETRAEVTPRAGQGVGVVEAPRGILYHRYVFDDDGRITEADCVIPTTQNHANIHHDLRAMVPVFAGQPGMDDDELTRLCSMLVRAYDPCISCSVH